MQSFPSHRPSLAWVAILVAIGALIPASARAQGQFETVKPYFLVIQDNSGSMDTCTDGTNNHSFPNCNGTNSCGQQRHRMGDSKCVLGKIVTSYGDALFGLERFTQFCSGASCGAPGTLFCSACIGPAACDGCDSSDGTGCDADGASATRGEILVPIVEQNASALYQWVDFTCGTCDKTGGNPELTYGQVFTGTWTPLGGSLRAARRYFEGMDPDFASPIMGDPFAGCRPYYVILQTDGDETCAPFGQTLASANELHTTSFGGKNYNIKTFVIGFGHTPGDAGLEAIANAGGTDAPGANKAFYATDESSLSVAFSQIIGDSLLSEKCNGEDDNCNGACDENFPEVKVNATSPTGKTCNNPHAAQACSVGVGACARSGVFVCTADGRGTRCVDPMTGNPPVAGTPGTETCPPNNIDDDCNGVVDDIPGGCPNCTTEVCNGRDDDCDGQTDELNEVFPCPTGAANPANCVCPGGRSCGNTADLPFCSCAPTCGTSVGICTPGHLACTGGGLHCVGGQQPQTEVCNCLDDDCNGNVDDNTVGEGTACQTFSSSLQTAPPAQCRKGAQHCEAMGATCGFRCVGEIGPSAEVCDNIDNDCDGMLDTGSLCPGSTPCANGVCAPHCNASEQPCPANTRCLESSTLDDCLPPRADCLCMPNVCLRDCNLLSQDCVIRGGRAVCTDRCPPGKCNAPQTCDPRTGHCIDCYTTGCPQGQACIQGACGPDPCANVVCGTQQFCRQGTCVNLCSAVTCSQTEECVAGDCRPARCAGVSCSTGMVCNPTTGNCAPNQCVSACANFGDRCVQTTGQCIPDPCATTHCPTCNECYVTPEGASDCRAISGCKGASSVSISPAGGGGLSCALDPHAGMAWGTLLFAGFALVSARIVRRRSTRKRS